MRQYRKKSQSIPAYVSPEELIRSYLLDIIVIPLHFVTCISIFLILYRQTFFLPLIPLLYFVFFSLWRVFFHFTVIINILRTDFVLLENLRKTFFRELVTTNWKSQEKTSSLLWQNFLFKSSLFVCWIFNSIQNLSSKIVVSSSFHRIIVCQVLKYN